MSKLMILFVLLVSGALYDPPRVLNQLGPEASRDRLEDRSTCDADASAPVSWHELSGNGHFRDHAQKITTARVKPAGSSRLEMCPAPASST